MIKFADLQKGRRYRVEFDDCCVQGHFEDTFVEFETDEDGDPDGAVFMNARIEPEWGRYTFTEAAETIPENANRCGSCGDLGLTITHRAGKWSMTCGGPGHHPWVLTPTDDLVLDLDGPFIINHS
jgi:hypothetical protein